MVIKKQLKKDGGDIKSFLELNSILKIVSILFILSITVLAIVNIFDGKENKSDAQNVISVSGHGEISLKPDTTKFTISVTETGKDMKTSQDAAKAKINSAIAILKQNGVPDKNIKNINYDTYPKYSSRTSTCSPSSVIKGAPIAAPAPALKSLNTSSSSVVKSRVVSKTSTTKTNVASVAVAGSAGVAGSVSPNCIDRTSEIIGYETNQSIEVKITDISKNPDLAGVLISAVGAIGVQTSGLTSFIDNIDLSKQYAREQAILKAKTQAKDIAESLDIKLGKITSFSENTNGGGYPYPMMMNAKVTGPADSAPISLPTGETTVTSDVNITYSIR